MSRVEVEERVPVGVDISLEGSRLGLVVEEEPQRVDKVLVVIVLDVLGDGVHLVRGRRQEDDPRGLAAVVAKGKELLSELAGRLVGSKQVFEPLELVEDDQVRLEGVHADAGQLIAKRADELTPIGEVILGPVLSFPAEPLAEIVELLPEPRLSSSASRLVVARRAPGRTS